MAEPNVQQRALIAGILEGKSKRQAALDAGYSPTSSTVGTPLKSKVVRTALQEAFDKAGLSDDKLAKTAAKGLKARRAVFHEGALVGEPPDWGARHSFFRTVLEVRGDLKPQGQKDDASWEALVFAVRSPAPSQPAAIDILPNTEDTDT